MLGGIATTLDVLFAPEIELVGCQVYVSPAAAGAEMLTVLVKQTVGLLIVRTGLIVGNTLTVTTAGTIIQPANVCPATVYAVVVNGLTATVSLAINPGDQV